MPKSTFRSVVALMAMFAGAAGPLVSSGAGEPDSRPPAQKMERLISFAGPVRAIPWCRPLAAAIHVVGPDPHFLLTVQDDRLFHLSTKPLDGSALLEAQPMMAQDRRDSSPRGQEQKAVTATRVRFATFNVWELTSAKLARVDAAGRGTHAQLGKAAEIIQRVRPDVLLINEMDFDPQGRKNAALFLGRYLQVPQSGQPPLDYPYVFFEPVNTGVPTGLDLDNDGKTHGPEDAFGYGQYEGQYGMALYSRFPIDREAVRTFQHFKWKDLPGNLMPDGTGGKPDWYAPREAAVLRLSSKSHWDVPLRVPTGRGDAHKVIHVLASHPTPPVFDGAEDRNGRRNFDEIRLWADYIAGGDRTAYLVDDRGHRGGLAPEASFVIMGDLNAEPDKVPRPYGLAAIEPLLKSPRVQDPQPRRSALAPSLGTPPPATSLPSPTTTQASSSAPPDSALRTPHSALFKTADFGRIDYVLPSADLKVVDAGVFWPAPGDPLHRLIADPDPSSDHRLVWVDVAIEP